MIRSNEENKPPDKFITVAQVMERLSCSDRFVYKLIEEGVLVAIKIGPRAIRISEKSLDNFTQANVIDPEEYIEKEPPKQTASKIARSSWMTK